MKLADEIRSHIVKKRKQYEFTKEDEELIKKYLKIYITRIFDTSTIKKETGNIFNYKSFVSWVYLKQRNNITEDEEVDNFLLKAKYNYVHLMVMFYGFITENGFEIEERIEETYIELDMEFINYKFIFGIVKTDDNDVNIDEKEVI